MRKFLSLLALAAMAALPLADAQNATPTPAGGAAATASPKKRARKAANPSPSPGTAANPAASPTKRTRKSEKASPSPANAAVTAASPSPTPGGLFGAFKKKSAAPAPMGTPGGANTVWVNTDTHVYHKQGSRFYGKTKQGKYVSEQDAIKEGDHPAKNEK